VLLSKNLIPKQRRSFCVMVVTCEVDEETPLLRVQPKKRTPLPWFQLIIVLFLQLGEPLTSQVIYPFAPQVGDDYFIGPSC